MPNPCQRLGLVGRKVGEDVFVEAGINYVFLYF